MLGLYILIIIQRTIGSSPDAPLSTPVTLCAWLPECLLYSYCTSHYTQALCGVCLSHWTNGKNIWSTSCSIVDSRGTHPSTNTADYMCVVRQIQDVTTHLSELQTNQVTSIRRLSTSIYMLYTAMDQETQTVLPRSTGKNTATLTGREMLALYSYCPNWTYTIQSSRCVFVCIIYIGRYTCSDNKCATYTPHSNNKTYPGNKWLLMACALVNVLYMYV